MKEKFAQWLSQIEGFPGALACAVRGADGVSSSRTWTSGFSEASIENALRCVADLFQVIQHNRISPGRVRWVFGEALLHCERRADGACFGVFTTRRGEAAVVESGLDRLFAGFRQVGMTSPLSA